VRARRRVHAAIRKPQSGDGLTADQVTIDDLGDVGLGDASVPHSVWSRQPDLLARMRRFIPRSARACLNAF
jgi:hypothetical protein